MLIGCTILYESDMQVDLLISKATSATTSFAGVFAGVFVRRLAGATIPLQVGYSQT